MAKHGEPFSSSDLCSHKRGFCISVGWIREVSKVNAQDSKNPPDYSTTKEAFFINNNMHTYKGYGLQ